MSDPELPGVKKIISRIADSGESMSPEALVESCLDEMGPLPVKDETREELVSHAREQGDLSWDDNSYRESAVRASEMLSLIASTREYQFG